MDLNPPGNLPSLLPTFGSSNWYSLRRTKLKPKLDVIRLRFLLGKILHEKEIPSEGTVAETFDLAFRLGGISEPTFVQEHGFLLFLLLGFRSWNSPSALQSEMRSLTQSLRKIFPHSREYFSLKSELIRATLSLHHREPKRFPVKRYIGVGHDDKGSQADKIQDDSPSWKEIYSDAWFQYQNERKETNRYLSPVEGRLSISRSFQNSVP